MKQQLLKKKQRDVELLDENPNSQNAPEGDDRQACIAHRAYELYEHEGCCHGQDLAHWLQAEREILEVEPKN